MKSTSTVNSTNVFDICDRISIGRTGDTQNTMDVMKTIGLNLLHQHRLVFIVNIVERVLNILDLFDDQNYVLICVVGEVELMETYLLPCIIFVRIFK